jgi:hypothetical protein
MGLLAALFSSPRRAILVILGVVVFLAISAVLARWLSLENVERDDVLAVLQAQAAGNERSMRAQLHQCIYGCPADVRYDARTLKRPGKVLILAYDSQTAYALTTTEGWTRVAWKAGPALPVVQCFKVRRNGNAISGLTVTLLRVSRPIPDTSDC